MIHRANEGRRYTAADGKGIRPQCERATLDTEDGGGGGVADGDGGEAGSAPVGNIQFAGTDGCGTAISIGAGQGEHPRTTHGQGAGAADDAAQGDIPAARHGVGPAQGDRRIDGLQTYAAVGDAAGKGERIAVNGEGVGPGIKSDACKSKGAVVICQRRQGGGAEKQAAGRHRRGCGRAGYGAAGPVVAAKVSVGGSGGPGEVCRRSDGGEAERQHGQYGNRPGGSGGALVVLSFHF